MNGRGSEETDRIVLVALAMLFGPGLVASFVPKVCDQVAGWLLDSHVLVPAGRALVEVPGLGAGPDLRRVAIAVLVLALATWVLVRRRIARQLEQSEKATS